ncbi:MAG: hypothetical protein ACRDRT_11230 [Pseudonocardiaceae bacterium]
MRAAWGKGTVIAGILVLAGSGLTYGVVGWLAPDASAMTKNRSQLLRTSGVPSANIPANGLHQQKVDSELLLWHTHATTSSSRAWSELPLTSGTCKGDIDACTFSPVLVRSNGRLTITWSGVIAGAPVEMRVLDRSTNGNSVLAPGIVSTKDHAGMVSFTFVSTDLHKDACQGIAIQWRSPTGKLVKISKTTTVVRYKDSGRTEKLGCA